MKRFILVLGLMGLLIGNISLAATETASFQTVQSSAISADTAALNATVQNALSQLNHTPLILDANGWPVIEGEAAFVYNPKTGEVMYEKNADRKWAIASIVKVMTAVVAEDILKNFAGAAQMQIVVQNATTANAADALLKRQSIWNPLELIKYMLIGSSNRAAEAIANNLIPRSSFMSLMDHKAREWGLMQTSFNNPSGLSIQYKNSEQAGAVSTARETAHMMWLAYSQYGDALGESTVAASSSFSGVGYSVSLNNTNKLLGHLPIVFGKTGLTDLSGGNLAVIVQKDQMSDPYVVVVLGSSAQNRFTDVEKLAQKALSSN